MVDSCFVSTSLSEKRNIPLFFVWPHHTAFGILVPQTGIEPVLPALKVQDLNHWTTREVQGGYTVDLFSSPYLTLDTHFDDI